MKGLIFTYGLTYGGGLAALFNPFIGLLIYICFAIVKPDVMWSYSVPLGNYSRIVAFALLLGWLFHGFGQWHFGRALPVVVAVVAYWGWALALTPFAVDQARAWSFVEGIGKIVLPFVVGITILDSVAKLKVLAWVVVLSQTYVAYEFNASYFAGYNRLLEEGFSGMDNNSHAIALVTCVGMAVFLGLDAQRLWAKGLALLSALLMIHAIFFSFSRGGMIALAITACLTFWLIPKRWQHYLVFALLVVASLRLAGLEVIARFQTVFADQAERDASAQSRLQLWGACWDSMLHRPLGVGPDQWGVYVSAYGWEPGKSAHSLWLQTGAELGFPGLLLLAAFYGICIYRLWPIARQPAEDLDPWLTQAARMTIASLVGFMVAAQFVSLDRLELPFYVTLVGAGVLKLAGESVSSVSPASLDFEEVAPVELHWQPR